MGGRLGAPGPEVIRLNTNTVQRLAGSGKFPFGFVAVLT